jgi:hypothetical protein
MGSLNRKKAAVFIHARFSYSAAIPADADCETFSSSAAAPIAIAGIVFRNSDLLSTSQSRTAFTAVFRKAAAVCSYLRINA